MTTELQTWSRKRNWTKFRLAGTTSVLYSLTRTGMFSRREASTLLHAYELLTTTLAEFSENNKKLKEVCFNARKKK